MTNLLQEAFDEGFAAVKAYIDGEIGDIGRRLAAVENAPGAIGVTGAVIDRDGHLVLTQSDGSTKDIGQVCGEDGKPGDHGLGFDDLSVEHDGERNIVLRFARGELTKEFPITMPVVIDRGVWLETKGDGYAKGDAVTWAGSVWISQKDANSDKPDGGGWRLAVKRGRDGKDAVVRDVPSKPVKVS